MDKATAALERQVLVDNTPRSAMFGMGDLGSPCGPDFFLGGLVMRRPLESERDVSSSRLATWAYLHSVWRLIQARQ